MKRLKISHILNNKDFVYALSLFVFIAFISISFYELSKTEVTVVQEGETMTVRTHAKTVGDVLNELAIEVGEHDELSHEVNELVNRDITIEHTIAKEVVVSIDGDDQTYYTTSDTVGDFLQEQDIEMKKHDHMSLADSTEIKDNLEIDIEKAFQVTINDAGEKEKIWTTGGTVKELLADHDVKLAKLDRVKPKKSTKVKEDTSINITRVEKITDVVEEEQDYSVVKKNDDSLEKGTEEVVSEGESGLIEKHYEVVLENGEEVSRELIEEEVKKESQEKVVAVGTKVEQPKQTATPAASNEQSSKSSNTNNTAKSEPKTETVSRGSEEKEGKTLYMKATAYNWDCASCDGRGLTATGYDLKNNPEGVVAVDPSVIPLGSKVWVEGYGYAIARDTGGNIKGNKIDLHMSSQQKAQNYGTKTVQVKIIE
ncbi:ubiquitin-like domain-containing protein [Gracilibacillus sp. S3-1-1]|uniref:Ubiquitin-like domain-containing protein n=1 Tax=Gracilibacillus pellucidus TaxID=3095368 RepID=A0ACC6M967_9BACI|nr:ubiquitin-like domain-containing protein [Gracilibacillus sp. S3-1-1]MDX8047524.1 ubiquitin-like domain-containing protein [Gracilibacillus sp. S3-1-1]